MTGDLFLGGGGSASQEREVWRAAFDGVRRVIYWPFALPGERVSQAPGWLRDSLASLGIQAEVDAWLSLEGHTPAELETADLLFVGGGTTSKLLEHICEHGFRDPVAGFVARGGRYYGGSAGALIAGESIMLAGLAGNDSRAAASPAALGLFSGVAVLPHADTFTLTDIRSWARQLGQRIVAIPEAGGLRVHEDEWAAIGPGQVTLIWGEGQTVFQPGSRIPISGVRLSTEADFRCR
jgi:dipeptidase E